MILRPYQSDAVEAVYSYLESQDGNPCVVIPTAGGKTPVIATICRDVVETWSGSILVLAHVKELLEQSAEKLRLMAPQLPMGLYSAGLGRRDVGYAVTIAGIQSVYDKAHIIRPPDVVLIDEAHLIPFDGEGMYRQFLQDLRVINPQVRLVALTATPYRMKGGMICGPDKLLSDICYEISIRDLIQQGYLTSLRTKGARETADLSGVAVRGGEFVAGQAEKAMDSVVKAACGEIIHYTRERRSVLIFAAGVNHAQHVVETLRKRRHSDAEMVVADSIYRDSILDRFRAGRLKYLVNVNVLTTGFDAPNIDCVVLLRPTMSPGLYYQMCGRGFRVLGGVIDGIADPAERLAAIAASAKPDCLVLDFGGNVKRHGPIDEIEIRGKKPKSSGGEAAKECPKCREMVPLGCLRCPGCDHAFPEPERGSHDSTASADGILSDQVPIEEDEVRSVYYCVHYKRGADEDAPRTMRVDYHLGFNRIISEWVCFEHTGFARNKAENWWRLRSRAPIPGNCDEAVELAKAGALAETTHITHRQAPNERFARVLGYRLGEKPAFEMEDRPAAVPTPEGLCGNCQRNGVTVNHRPDGWVELCAWCGVVRRWLGHEDPRVNAIDESEIPF